MKRAKQTLLVILVLAVLLPLATIVVPVPTHDTALIHAKDFRSGLIASAFFAWLYVGAAILFLIGLDVFKERLKRTYTAICLGLVLYGIASVQVPILVATKQLDSPWGLNGGLLAPFVLGTLLMYLGQRSFAVALGFKSIWTSRTIILSIAFAVALLFGWLARDWSQLTFSNVSFAGNIANICLGTASLVLAIRVRLLAGPAYTNALTWFMLAIAASWLGQFPSPLFEVLDIPESAILAVPLAVSGALFVKAGYAFNKIREY
jgi:hypothetical protein